MIVIIEKSEKISRVIDIVDAYENLIKDLVGKFSDKYQELEDTTKEAILSNSTFESKDYLVKYNQKYVLYKKSLTVVKGYLYNSSHYNVVKICQWNILPIGNSILRSRLEKIIEIDDLTETGKADNYFDIVYKKRFTQQTYDEPHKWDYDTSSSELDDWFDIELLPNKTTTNKAHCDHLYDDSKYVEKVLSDLGETVIEDWFDIEPLSGKIITYKSHQKQPALLPNCIDHDVINPTHKEITSDFQLDTLIEKPGVNNACDTLSETEKANWFDILERLNQKTTQIE